MNKAILTISSFIVVSMIASIYVHAEEATISIDALDSKGQINKKIFGSNLLGYDPAIYKKNRDHYYGHADYGAGIWDPKQAKPNIEAVRLAKEAGITILRFPGGCGSHNYKWKNAIGKDREHNLFGIDEFIETSKEIGAEPVFTVSFFIGNEQDAADLVEYLNSADDGKRKWAKERADNGHKNPYKVKYFEFDNETWHGNHNIFTSISPQEYAQRYLRYREKMKAVDPDIELGVVLYNLGYKKNKWNETVLNVVKNKGDFFIVHAYPPHFTNRYLYKHVKLKDLFAITLACPVIHDQIELGEIKDQILKICSIENVKIAVTEFNAYFVQDEPVPYRHCLGTALLNAELLKIFMNPQNNVMMANYWNLCNEYWGMIANGFKGNPDDLYNAYYKRPNYYVFDMHRKHFGDILLNVDVKCDTYDVSQYRTFKQKIKDFIKRGIISGGNLLPANWDIKEFKGAISLENNGILEIVFSQAGEFNYFHSVKRAKVEPGTYYKLSGYIKTENLNDLIGMCLEVQDSRGWNITKSAESTDKITGTNNWTYVEAIYRTLDDANGVKVIARRIDNSGPLYGKAYFKDVKLEKFIPDLDTKIPYLSVNASKSADGKKVYLMVINKDMDASMTATIDLKDFAPIADGNAWVLNGPSVDATNEVKHDNVKITHKTFEIASSRQSGARNDESIKFEFTFEPHSLTAIEIEGRVVNAEFGEKVQ